MIIIKKIIAAFSIFLVLFSFSSCKASRRINNLSIIQAIGIDYENDEYKVCLQILDINKGTGTNEGVKGNITAVVSSKGSTVMNAISDINKTISDTLFFGQNKLIVLGSRINEKSKEIHDFLSDATVVRPDVYVLKSIDKAEQIIKNKQGGSRVPPEKICNQMRKEKCVFTVNDYLNGLKKNDIPVIEAAGDYTRLHKNKMN